jgi:drug/metabolite transporter (DMT)-like permease
METGFIYAIIAAVLWGLLYTIDQKILAHLSPILLLFISSIITAVIIFPFVLFQNTSINDLFIQTKANWPLVLLSIVLGATSSFFILKSISLIGATNASVIEIAYPLFVVLFSFIIFKAVPNLYFLFGGSLIFIGSLIIIKFAN